MRLKPKEKKVEFSTRVTIWYDIFVVQLIYSAWKNEIDFGWNFFAAKLHGKPKKERISRGFESACEPWTFLSIHSWSRCLPILMCVCVRQAFSFLIVARLLFDNSTLCPSPASNTLAQLLYKNHTPTKSRSFKYALQWNKAKRAT